MKKTIDIRVMILYNSEAVKFETFTASSCKIKREMKGVVFDGKESADCSAS